MNNYSPFSADRTLIIKTEESTDRHKTPPFPVFNFMCAYNARFESDDDQMGNTMDALERFGLDFCLLSQRSVCVRCMQSA